MLQRRVRPSAAHGLAAVREDNPSSSWLTSATWKRGGPGDARGTTAGATADATTSAAFGATVLATVPPSLGWVHAPTRHDRAIALTLARLTATPSREKSP